MNDWMLVRKCWCDCVLNGISIIAETQKEAQSYLEEVAVVSDDDAVCLNEAILGSKSNVDLKKMAMLSFGMKNAAKNMRNPPFSFDLYIS